MVKKVVKKEADRRDPINPYSKDSAAYHCFQLLVAGMMKEDLIDELETRILELDEVEKDPQIVLNAMMNAMGTGKLIDFTVRKNGKGILVLDRRNKEEEKPMSTRTAKKKVLAKAKKNNPTKVVKKVKTVKTVVQKNGNNPFQPGFGIYLVFETLSKGGTYNELLARVKGKFQKGQIGSSPKGRLDTVITITGKSGQLKNFKIIRKGKGKAETLQIAKK